MFIALDADNKRIHITNAVKTNEYYCPVCGEKLSVKAVDSLAVKAHYAHKKGTECLDDWKYYPNCMSEWHYNWQACFPEECREVVVGKDGVKHRADVLINNVVIEFQHSPISAEEIHQRNEFYLSCGYRVVWVFDANKKIKNKVDFDLRHYKFLEWKRARAEFQSLKMDGVTVFIEYNTREQAVNTDQNVDIMLLLSKIDEKRIYFVNTAVNSVSLGRSYRSYLHICRGNFLKSFGLDVGNGVLSIIEILEFSKNIECKPLVTHLPPRNDLNRPIKRRWRL